MFLEVGNVVVILATGMIAPGKTPRQASTAERASKFLTTATPGEETREREERGATNASTAAQETPAGSAVGIEIGAPLTVPKIGGKKWSEVGRIRRRASVF